MTFNEAWRTVLLQKYATFSGRARRSELWWYVLFQICVMIAASIIDAVIFRHSAILTGIAWLALLIPSVAVVVRRLHDTNRSGWWYLIAFVPAVGGLILLYFCILRGTPGSNNYGADPTGAEAYAPAV